MIQKIKLEDFEDAGFDPHITDEMLCGTVVDPYPTLHAMMEQGAVHEVEYRTLFSPYPDVNLTSFRHFTVVGYDAVSAALMDIDNFLNEAFRYTLGESFGESLSIMDPPDHPKFRRGFQKAFNPSTLAQWKASTVERVVREAIDRFINRGCTDLVEDFARPIPFEVVYRQLGLPADEIDIFRRLAMTQVLVSVDRLHGQEAGKKLGRYFSALIAERRRHPGDDLVSTVAAIRMDDGNYLPDEVLISFLRQLINAGGDTTYRATTVLLSQLLENPEQLEAVRQDRSLVPLAVEEALRWDGPVTATQRLTKRAVTIDGVTIPGGSIVALVLQSANRDPRKFADPDRFDIFRDRTTRHFAFAMGPHNCLGQHLARIEISTALNAVLDRLSDVRLDPDRPRPEIRGHLFRAAQHIHVQYG